MALKEFRTYQRRGVTRKSGFKASGQTTGGEAKVKISKAILFKEGLVLNYYRDKIIIPKLFKRNIGIIALGLYVLPSFEMKVTFNFTCEFNGKKIEKIFEPKLLEGETWNSIGAIHEFDITEVTEVSNCKIDVIFNSDFEENYICICCDDFDAISFDYFINNDCYDMFKTKINLNTPHSFYLKTDLDYLQYVQNIDKLCIQDGDVIILKSCNRCMRYLPINIEKEEKTLGFALHCKKRAPCTHHNFHDYNVVENDCTEGEYERIDEANKIYSYFGHQLECKGCKKFFVNAALNPMRNAEQFKEDGLRRRAFEMLVDNLLDKELVHHEFRKKTGKEFTTYIFNKFGGRCFKCGKKLNSTNEMNLDHTMPLAYLYRLDETATCLCDTHNSSKNDHFPSEYYSNEELIKLSEITGLPLEILNSTSVNMKVVSLLIQPENTVWFFDEFLANKDYQKIRDGRLTADKIYSALVRVLPKDINLIDIYVKEKQVLPKTISLK